MITSLRSFSLVTMELGNQVLSAGMVLVNVMHILHMSFLSVYGSNLVSVVQYYSCSFFVGKRTISMVTLLVLHCCGVSKLDSIPACHMTTKLQDESSKVTPYINRI